MNPLLSSRLRIAAAVLLCGGLLLAVWAVAMRPVLPPDAPGLSGVAFSPFQRGQSPEAGDQPTRAQIVSDLRVARGLAPRIRTYTVQGAMAEVPGLAAASGLRTTLGAWLSGDRAANARELERLVIAAGGAGVDGVLVGNEVILRADLPVAELVAAIRRVRGRVAVPVSTAEPWHVWLAHPELAAAVDVITLHLLPYWEGLPLDDALRFSFEKLDAVRAAYPGKKIVVGEVGWPSKGVAIGAARAGVVEQAQFLRGWAVQAAARGVDYFVMEAFDQPWKTSFEGRAAGYWGVLDLDRQAKWAMAGPVAPYAGWGGFALGAVLAAGLATVLLLRQRPDMAWGGMLLVSAIAQVFAAQIAGLMLVMGETYLSTAAAIVWVVLLVAQGLLVALLLSIAFEWGEARWGRAWRRVPVLTPAARGAALPKVSIHVPCCNEPPAMLRRTLEALAVLDYPDFEVLVIDNNTTDPALWEPVAEMCARLGPRFRFFTLGRWPGFKAGALNFAAAHTAADAEIIAVIDSDYMVARDWLRRTVPQFADPKVGFVQSPQDYRDAFESPFKRLMFWEYAGFFKLGMVTRNERNAIIQHGTMTLVRRTALNSAREPGGHAWAEWCICEDAELGLRLFRAGWLGVYAQASLGRGLMPDDFAAFRKQRFRWAYGAMQILRRHARALLLPGGGLTLGQRWHFVTGWMPWLGDALGLAFLAAGLVWSVGLVVAPVRFEFPIVAFMLPPLALFGLRIAQGISLYAARVPCGVGARWGAMAAGLALSHAIGLAVWKGLVVRSAPFLRTPKLRDAPALIQGLAMVRSEAALLALIWLAAGAVGWTHKLATWEARLWCVMLLVQSLPYLAAVGVSLAAALPARRVKAAVAWEAPAAGD